MKTTFFLLILALFLQCRTQEISPAGSLSPTVLNCPVDFEVQADASQPLGFVSWEEPTATGASYRIYRSYRPNSMLPIGENEIIYVFTDENDNRAACSFKVTVKSVDTNPPIVYNCPDDVSTTVEVGSKHVAVDWTEPAGMDDSGVAILKERTHWPGQLFPVTAKQMVRYTYIDSSLNEAYCTFNVLITTEDTTKPQIISCPNIVTREVELHSNGSYVEWTNPTASDNSGSVNVISMSHSRGDFFPIGITKVEHTFGDEAGNTATCLIDVVVTEVDRMVPKILHCPNDIIAGVKVPSTTIAVHWTEPTASDNSGKALMTGRSNAPGSEFQLGTSTEVIYQFSDQSGNTAYCSFDVMVINDTTKPTIIGCPTRIIRQINRSEKGMRVTWEEPIASDDTAHVEKMFNTHSSGDFFYVGSTGVEYVFKDMAGNTEECSFEVQITYVAEIVSGDAGSNDNSQASSTENQLAEKMLLVLPITAGTIIVLVSVVIVIGIYRVKRINHGTHQNGYQHPKEHPFYVLTPEDYDGKALRPSIPPRLPGLSKKQLKQGIQSPTEGTVWKENMKYRKKGASNRTWRQGVPSEDTRYLRTDRRKIEDDQTAFAEVEGDSDSEEEYHGISVTEEPPDV